ncbi:MAG: siphovirus Gp157 family protein, partial [Odoribacter sp.]|nr:siphovirus Gp157 family protein [Odoribacter sp.]
MIHFFRHPVSRTALPERFTNPFQYTPHALCIEAAKEVQDYLSTMNLWERHPEEGKMFGVLVVRTPDGQIGFLAAFSGILDGSYLHPYFVPPIYNLQQPDGFFRQEEKHISNLNEQIRQLENNPEYLQAKRKQLEKNAQAEASLKAAKIQLKAEKAKRDRLRCQNSPDFDPSALIRESQYQKAEYKRLEKYWKEQTDIAKKHMN